MKLPLRILVLVLLSMMIIGCKSKKKTVRPTKPKLEKKKVKKNLVDFYYGPALSPVLDLAKKEGKIVYLDIHASWCLPCKMMEQDVYTDKALASYLNKNFINYRVDLEKENGPDLRIIYDASPLPTLLFLDENGRVLERKQGAAYPTELRRLGDLALAKYRSNSLE